MLGGELHSRPQRRGRASSTIALARARRGRRPLRRARSAPRGRLAAARAGGTDPDAAVRAARDLRRRARAATRSRGEVVDEVARRIALHIVPVAAVTDVGLVVLGGGIGANGDLLLEPVRELLAIWLPYPPRLEISSLGEAAVLSGALAFGLRTALDDVFVNRARALPAELFPLP